jgi:hypothetical protein
MTKNVRVFDASNNAVGSTYKKRASQLVKKTRARWIDGDSIKLKEDTGMEFEAYPIPNSFPERVKRRDGDVKGVIGKFLHDERKFVSTRFYGADAEWLDEEVETYAKAKMIAKRRLILHAAGCLSTGAALVMLCAASSLWMLYEAVLSICGLWGVALVMHFVVYMTRPTPFKLQKEMRKLRRRI